MTVKQGAEPPFAKPLQARIKGGGHHQVVIAGAGVTGHLFHHPVDEVAPGAAPCRGPDAALFLLGPVRLLPAQVARRHHVGQHLGGAAPGAFQAGLGVVARRRLQQPRQHGRLVDGKAPRRLAEIASGRRFHPVGAGTEIDAIEVDGEDLVLGEMVFQPERQQNLLDLALHGARGREKQVLGHLLGDGAAALDDAPGTDIGHHRPRQADRVEAEVGAKAPVLGRQHRLGQGLGQHIEGHRAAMLIAERRKHAAVAGPDRHRRAARRGQGVVDVGKIGGIPGDHQGDGDEHPHPDRRRPLRRPPREPAGKRPFGRARGRRPAGALAPTIARGLAPLARFGLLPFRRRGFPGHGPFMAGTWLVLS